MQLDASIEYLACGGNRYPSGADWDTVTGALCFGAGRNVAVWDLRNDATAGITGLLRGHEGTVTATKFFHLHPESPPLILSGSADHTIRLWKRDQATAESITCVKTLIEHKGSINCLAILPQSGLFVSGAADGSIKVWKISQSGAEYTVELLQDLQVKPKTIPLALSLALLGHSDALVLAVAGTKNVIQIYSSLCVASSVEFSLQASLPGHDAWIRALEFKQESSDTSELLLASASQDKYIRLWRVRQRAPQPPSTKIGTSADGHDLLLSNKSHAIIGAKSTYDITFEALLLGHEDWIYTIRWTSNQDSPQLLSASADNSLVIWEPDDASGIWVSKARLGEISAMKGSTTATGTAGGLWVGLWIEKDLGIVALGRNGSWRRWAYNQESDEWVEKLGVGGHTGEVRDLSWSVSGSYLLSASADQTTRAHAMWQQGNATSWHEYSRPQIHGYDLNCIGCVSDSQFVSGADEKLVRVFDAPQPFLATLAGEVPLETSLDLRASDPEAWTSVPVLGLSNKAIIANANGTQRTQGGPEDPERNHVITSGGSIKATPPMEDHLARKTLWPEREKLYGHGFEISCLAVSSSGNLVATACKASSLEHAVIRIYDQKTWRPLNPPLIAHSLTVTGIAFSDDDRHLLSVGRDRQWTVFESSSSDSCTYVTRASNPKGHSRMVLGCAWVPSRFGQVFGTAGRDKACKIWALDHDGYTCRETISIDAAATSISFCSNGLEQCIMALGTETGGVTLHVLDMTKTTTVAKFDLEKRLCPALSVTRLCWQPQHTGGMNEQSGGKRLAISSQDHSVTIVRVQID